MILDSTLFVKNILWKKADSSAFRFFVNEFFYALYKRQSVNQSSTAAVDCASIRSGTSPDSWRLDGCTKKLPVM